MTVTTPAPSTRAPGFAHESTVNESVEWYTLVSQDAAFAQRLTLTDSGCWVFTGQVNTKGYGKVHRRGLRDAPLLTHRYAWFLIRGEWPGEALMHVVCDNPPCCNPAHLQDGTRLENNRDMWNKGRAKPPPVSKKKYSGWQCAHLDTPDNHTGKGGRLECRTCYNEYQREGRRRRKLRGLGKVAAT